MKTNPTSTEHTVQIKTPYRFLWSFCIVTILFGHTFSIWTPTGLADTVFWIILTAVISMTIYAMHLLLKYYNKNSATQVAVNTDGTTTIKYQLVRWLGVRTFDSSTIKVAVKRRTLRLLVGEKTVVKIHRDTLFDANDWDWMLNYYRTD